MQYQCSFWFRLFLWVFRFVDFKHSNYCWNPNENTTLEFVHRAINGDADNNQSKIKNQNSLIQIGFFGVLKTQSGFATKLSVRRVAISICFSECLLSVVNLFCVTCAWNYLSSCCLASSKSPMSPNRLRIIIVNAWFYYSLTMNSGNTNNTAQNTSGIQCQHKWIIYNWFICEWMLHIFLWRNLYLNIYDFLRIFNIFIQWISLMGSNVSANF